MVALLRVVQLQHILYNLPIARGIGYPINICLCISSNNDDSLNQIIIIIF